MHANHPGIKIMIGTIEVPEMFFPRIAKAIVALDRAEHNLWKVCYEIEDHTERYPQPPI